MVRIQTFLMALAGALALIAAGLAWYVASGLPQRPSGQSAAVSSIGGPFVLADQDGKTRTEKDFRGRFMLVYFGYTWCPDVCPTTLARISQALATLGPKAGRIVPVFITVDPERDKPPVLKKYVAAFGTQFVGLTGSLPAIARTAREYRVYFAKQKAAGGSYGVTHSSEIYLVGPDGKFVTFYDSDIGAGALAKDLKARI